MINQDKTIFNSSEKIYEALRKHYNNLPRFATVETQTKDPSLNSHIERMLIAFNQYVKPSIQEKLHELCEISIKFHDIGKLNPFFQYRMSNLYEKSRKIPIEKKWSYHSLNSALIAYICLKNLPENDRIAVANSIICHHSKLLILISEMPQLRNFEIELGTNNTSFLTSFQLTLQYIKEADLTIISKYKDLFDILAKTSIEDLSKFISAVIKNIREKCAELKKDNSNYLKIALVTSILTNIDVWEAKTGRTYNTAIKNIRFDIDRSKFHINQNAIDEFISNHKDEKAPLNSSRDLFQKHINQKLEKLELGKIYTITAPTGIGKTMGIMRIALKLRQIYQEKGLSPKIIYALPFLSICDQIETQLIELLNIEDSQNEQLTVHHSMASINQKLNKIPKKFINETFNSPYELAQWRSHFIVTTTIRLFNTLLRYFKGDLIRLHRLSNSIIIIDEYHTISVRYFGLLRIFLPLASKTLNCTFILATATTPALFRQNNPNVIELIDGMDFSQINRYFLNFLIKEQIDEEKFPEEILKIIKKRDEISILVVVNTRKLAFNIYKKLKNYSKLEHSIKHLSSNITPIDRKKKIEKIVKSLKSKEKIILVTTQLIEAGIDVSFQYLIRQFAPLHSIIQCAGRVNRSSEMSFPAEVCILKCSSKNNIYNQVDLDLTSDFFKGLGTKVSELTIREKLQNYAEKVLNYRKSSGAIKMFKNLDYPGVCQEFIMIDQNAPITIFACNISPEEEKSLITTISGPKKTVNQKYYSYSINLYENNKWYEFYENNKNLLIQLNDQNDENSKENISLYLLKLNQTDASAAYDKEIGLKLFGDLN